MANWYIDPENGSVTNNGMSEASPWLLIPGQTGASSQTGYTVAAGDTINVKNGTVSKAGRVVLVANNMTYRGYGLASNVLYITLPASDPTGVVRTKIVREEGVHEGMWTIDANGGSEFGYINFSSRSGCVVEDVNVIAPTDQTPVSMGTSTSTAIGCTLRRFRVTGSAATGIGAYSRQITIEDGEVNKSSDDAITLGASIENGYRAGYPDIIRRVAILEPAYNASNAIGDAFQTFASSDRFESSLLMEDIYVYKPNRVKQTFVFTDVAGGLTLRRFHIESTPLGQAQILFSGIGGPFNISDGYFKDGCLNNAVFRYAGSQGIETGTVLNISNIVVDAPINAGFFNWGGSSNAATVDGAVTITNCTMSGVNLQNLSFSGTVSTDPGSLITIGANASLTARNNCFTTTGQPAFRIPTGGANSPKWIIQNNAIGSGTCNIGTTSYATVTLFEAAHNGAINNLGGEVNIGQNFIPKTGSILINAGVYTGPAVSIQNTARNIPPTVGAYEYVSPRGNAGTRGTR